MELGVEGDIEWTNADGDTDCIVGPPFRCGVDQNWIATATGRLGFAWDRLLLYGEGGAAFADVDYPITGLTVSDTPSALRSVAVRNMG